jgi:hypothetical protein
LLTVKLRGENKHKADCLKLVELKAYMRSDEIQDLQAQLAVDYPKLTKDERRRRRAEITALTERKVKEIDAAEKFTQEIARDDTSAFSFRITNHCPKIGKK